MAITFNHATKRIHVQQVDATPLLLQNLINAIKLEESSERGIAYEPIAEATGKDDLGGGSFTGITVALEAGWMVEFEPGAYQARIDGGNFSGGLTKIANTGSPQVILQSSVATSLALSDGSGGQAGPTLEDIAGVIRTELGKFTPAPAPQVPGGAIPGTLSNRPKVVLPSSEPAPIVRQARVVPQDGRLVVASSNEGKPVAVIQGADPQDGRKVVVQR